MKPNITEAFKARLIALGFERDIEASLNAQLCFDPVQFEIGHSIKEKDGQCFFSVQCVRGDQGMYDALSYTAVLYRFPNLTETENALHEKAAAIAWKDFYHFSNPLEQQQAVEVVRLLIESDLAGSLRFRHWVGTPLENHIPNLAGYKTEYEISQRFYLLSQHDPITFTEAWRFLQSKWTERRMLADRKLLLKKEESAGTGSTGKLLTKRVRPNRKPGSYNK